LRDTVLSGADLRDADLCSAAGLTPDQLLQARGNRQTKLPPGLQPPAQWWKASENDK
jgi:uncharacterized protein YjbI with pentapeptide repeats